MRSSRRGSTSSIDEPVLDPAVGRDEHRDQLAVAQRHELDALEPLLVGIGRDDHRGVLREIARAGATRAARPRRASAPMTRSRISSRSRGDRPRTLSSESMKNRRPDVGRHAARRGVALLEQAQLLEVGHHVAHGRRRQPEIVAARDRARADRVAAGRYSVTTACRIFCARLDRSLRP